MMTRKARSTFPEDEPSSAAWDHLQELEEMEAEVRREANEAVAAVRKLGWKGPKKASSKAGASCEP